MIINNIEECSVKIYNTAKNGDLSILFTDKTSKRDVEKNPALYKKAVQALMDITDQFNDKIDNPQYRLDNELSRQQLLRTAKVGRLNSTLFAIEQLIEHYDVDNDAALRIDKVIQGACSKLGIKFTRDYLKLAKKINSKIELLKNQNEVDRQRQAEVRGDAENNADENSSIYDLLTYVQPAGFTIRPEDPLIMLASAVNSAAKVYKSKDNSRK